MNDNPETLNKIEKFQVGDFFSHKQIPQETVKFGWITGLGVSPAGEQVFTVKWSHRQGEQLLHPFLVEPVAHDWELAPGGAVMDKQDALTQLSWIRESNNNEASQGEAVGILLSFLSDNGHKDLVDAYNAADDRCGGFWFS